MNEYLVKVMNLTTGSTAVYILYGQSVKEVEESAYNAIHSGLTELAEKYDDIGFDIYQVTGHLA